MDDQSLILIFTSILLGGIGFTYYKRETHFKTALYAISLYTFSSIMSIVFYFQPLTQSNNQLNGNITLWPVLYWTSLFLISLMPLFQFDNSKIVKFTYKSNLLDKIVILGIIVSIIPFLEQLLLIPEILGGGNLDALGENMVDLHDESSLENMSVLGRNGLRFNVAIYDLSFIILFIQFLKEKKNKLIIFGLFFIIITRNLTGIIAGHRSAAIEVIMKVLLVAIIAYPLIGSKEKKVIKNFMIWSFSIVGAVFMVITIGRQMLYSVTKSEDFTMTYFLSWYAGEGLINFNQFLPLMKNTTNGEYTCWTLLQLLGESPHELDYDYMYGKLTRIQGIPQNIFYTYIGNFVQDFGFFFAAIIISISSSAVRAITKVRGSVMKISTLFFIFSWASIILRGVTSFCYNGSNGKFAILTIIIYFFLRVTKM